MKPEDQGLARSCLGCEWRKHEAYVTEGKACAQKRLETTHTDGVGVG